MSSTLLVRSRLALLGLLLLLVPFISSAQAPVATTASDEVATMPEEDMSQIEGVVLANVNLSDVVILSQTPSDITIGFTLTNGDSKIQSDIRYGIDLLLLGEDGGQTVFDFYVAPEVTALGPNQVVTKEIKYDTRGIASGEYELWVTAQTAGGVMLGLGSAGKVLIQSESAVVIDSESCVLTVAGESEEIEYDLYQGVDVASEEELVLKCTIVNDGLTNIDITPEFKSFVRTVYGDPVTDTFPPGISFPTQSFILEPGERKEISLEIPKPLQPQAYDTVLSFVDTKTKQPLSNQVAAHYVVQGVSATIQTVNFTKEEYKTGEEIELSLFWTGSADGFPDSRAGEGTAIAGDVRATVQIVDKDGRSCATPINQVLSEEITTLKTIASTECMAPKAEVSLLGPDGAVLDTSSIAVPYTAPAEIPTESAPVQTKSNNLMYVTVIVLALAALSTIVFIARRKRMEVDPE